MTRQQPDTGESTNSIIARGDDHAWPHVEALLKAGATLIRVAKLGRCYVDRGHGPSSPSLSYTRVRRLERAGVLRFVGIDRYDLAKREDAA